MSETPAPASPIATQEPDEVIEAQRCLDEAFSWDSVFVPGKTLQALIKSARALSASEKRNEELVRERDEARRALTNNYPGPARKVWAAMIEMAQADTRRQRTDAEALVTSLKAENERLTRALIRIERWDLPEPEGWKWPDGSQMSFRAVHGTSGEAEFIRDIARAALSPTKLEAKEDQIEAAESSVASLTRLVGDMREALEGVVASIKDDDESAAYLIAKAALAAIRALPLPALSTTGEPVGAAPEPVSDPPALDFVVFRDTAGRWFAVRDMAPKFVLTAESEQDARNVGEQALEYYATLPRPPGDTEEAGR